MSATDNIGNGPQTQHLGLPSELVKHFASLLRGRTDAWGSLGGNCNKELVTLDHYRRRLAGKVSLGIYPLRRDGRC